LTGSERLSPEQLPPSTVYPATAKAGPTAVPPFTVEHDRLPGRLIPAGALLVWVHVALEDPYTCVPETVTVTVTGLPAGGVTVMLCLTVVAWA
jgi:hypothetical protein